MPAVCPDVVPLRTCGSWKKWELRLLQISDDAGGEDWQFLMV